MTPQRRCTHECNAFRSKTKFNLHQNGTQKSFKWEPKQQRTIMGSPRAQESRHQTSNMQPKSVALMSAMLLVQKMIKNAARRVFTIG